MTETADPKTIEHLDDYTSHLVNYRQTLEERRAKFHLCRSMGCNNSRARRMRDWRLSKIERCLGLEETFNNGTHSYARQLNIA